MITEYEHKAISDPKSKSKSNDLTAVSRKYGNIVPFLNASSNDVAPVLLLLLLLLFIDFVSRTLVGDD
jgi:hypothetical protein